MNLKSVIPQKIKNYYHLLQAILANIIYVFPSRKITVIGVTGTNGKTTTCQMIARILEEAGHKVAMASTINFKLGEKEWVNKSKFTTTDSFQVQKFIKDAVNVGCKYLVLETSSHALDQNRVWGVKYKTAVITNVTREHLDYHNTMDEYRIAKYKLFCCVQTAVVNLEMEKPRDFLPFNIEEKYGYIKKEIDCSAFDCGKIIPVEAENIKLEMDRSEFEVDGQKYKLNLSGEFNIENALAAICVGMSEKINSEVISRALEKIKVVSGRMDKVPNERGLDIIIDYALTPDSLEKLYSLIQRINTKSGKIIAVFGSCGDRDRGKRPIMGEIVDKYADYIILTNEDPYSEDPVRIIDEVAKGVKNKKEGDNFWRIMDRREAIKKALEVAKSGDIVLVTGKGAEETMMIGKKMIPWNDKKVILEELRKH
jgi:UDP-N-acetylmuramoyl-L-alanyl-D-glutamate--2,6-diaminopimelate ligase